MKSAIVVLLLLLVVAPMMAQQVITKDGKSVLLKADGTYEILPDSAKATVHVYRYKQFMGKGLNPSVYCDEVQIAKMDNGRYFTVELNPGKHTFRSNDKQSEIALNAKPGTVYYIRVDIVSGFMKGHGRLTLIQAEQGEPETAKLQYLSPGDVKDSRMVLTAPKR